MGNQLTTGADVFAAVSMDQLVARELGIPLAAMGGLTPIVAGAAMALSSVTVVTNALSLNRWRFRFGEGR